MSRAEKLKEVDEKEKNKKREYIYFRKSNIFFYVAIELVPLLHSSYGYILFSSISDTCTSMWRRKWKIDFFRPIN